ncbi:MAG TPA: hypothetical protein VH081_02635 [Solirubrobacteraceae bacterium]|jgi:hypothetical protein|nr:hypothetical protein [Solirubrobacteraceae bacterium]
MRALDVVRLRLALLLLLVAGCSALVGASAALGDAPASTSAPSISGLARDGGKLKADRGSWEGAKPIVYSYGWSRCDASGAECAALASADRRTYKPGHEDVGHTLRVTVTAIGEGGAASASSLASEEIAAAPLLARKHPKIAGSASDGQLLSAGTGAWKGTPPQSFAYQWLSCPRGSGACSSIEGATASSYRVETAQIGRKLRVVVTASNAVGAVSSTSSASKPVTAGAPVSLQAPTIAGGLQEGQTLMASAGEWAGTGPLAYSYQWLRCSLVLGCSEIAGATSATYTAGVADLLSKLAVVVMASNAQGSATATSAETQPVLGVLPANTALPTISGTLKLNQLLSAASGAWSGSEPISYAYQWQLCVLGACTNIAKATSPTFLLGALDLANTLRVIVTATNVAGSTPATSAATGPIAGLL